MIRPRYTLKLARTKLQSKRSMLIASVIIASLLFASLITCVIVFTGAEKSATNFIKKAGNDRYLVRTSPAIPSSVTSFSRELSIEDIREIKAFEKQYYDDLREKYKSLGLAYGDVAIAPALQPAAWKSQDLPEEQRVSINFQSPAIEALAAQKYKNYSAHANNKFSDLKKIGDSYDASGYYLQKGSTLPIIPASRLLKDGKEDFGDSEMRAGDMSVYGYYTNSIHNSQYAFSDTNLLSRYLLTTDTSNLRGIPVVVSAQEAALLFGEQFNIGKEPNDAKEKYAWLSSIQSKLNGYTYQVCYRNPTEQALLSKIQRDYTDAKNNENNKDYIKAKLLYEYPSTSCGNIPIKQDTRSLAEKKADMVAEQVQKKLGTYTEAKHRLLTFQIVGIANAQPQLNRPTNVDSYIKTLLAPQDVSTWGVAIPRQMYESLPDSLRFDDIAATSAEANVLGTDDFAPRILEFKSIDDARAFMANETCPTSELNCDKKFISDQYGSNYLILDEISKLFAKIASIAFPIVLGLATIIIWFTVSRIMTDSRKETAVYRAMGAKRHDVASIYVAYILLIATRIAIASLFFGVAAAYAIDYLYGSALTDIATTASGIINNAPRFSLFSFDSPLIWITIASIFIVSLVGSIVPLIRNTLRPPIYDIRNE